VSGFGLRRFCKRTHLDVHLAPVAGPLLHNTLGLLIGAMLMPQTWEGIVFGRLYIKRGLEAAILAHGMMDAGLFALAAIGIGNRIFGRLIYGSHRAAMHVDCRRAVGRGANIMAEMGAYEAMSTLRAVRATQARRDSRRGAPSRAGSRDLRADWRQRAAVEDRSSEGSWAEGADRTALQRAMD